MSKCISCKGDIDIVGSLVCKHCLKKMGESPDKILESMAETFRERHNVYGDNYKQIGKVMMALFPDGVELKLVEDWNRHHLFMMMIVKLTRLANTDLTHKDSVHDLAVYAAMMESML